MSEKRPNLLRRVFNYVTGRDIAPQIDNETPPDRGDKKSDALAQTSDYSLFNRLKAESSGQGSVRRVKTDVLQGTKLVDEIIWLMFNVRRQVGTFQQNALVEALNKQPISTSSRVFYIYVDEKVDFPFSDYVLDRFYERLVDLSKKSTSLFNFLNERFRLHQQRVPGASPVDFAPTNPDHLIILANFFRCQISICRKPFPKEANDYVFIVGRMPLHDIPEIERYLFKQQSRSSPNEDNAKPPEVYLAVTVKAAGHHEDKPISFNAHRFGQQYDNSPQREYSLFIGNWRTDWEFSIGAAEHDEIQHPAMKSRSERLKLNNLQITNNYWDYIPPNPSLPPWMKFYNRDATREQSEGVRLCFVKPPVLDNPLLNVLNRRQFRQEISFIGRMLPQSGGQLQQFADFADRPFREAVRNLTATAAIQVRDSLWLIKTNKNGILGILQNDQRRWEVLNLEDGATFSIGDTEYKWHTARNDLYPDAFAGALSIYPAPAELPSYKKQLNVDKDADGFLVSYGGHFSADMNPDELLGSDGIVSIKCVDVSADGRGKYALLPVVREPPPTNPFFAFQPIYSREKGWPAGKVWLTYDDSSSSDLVRDEKSGEARYGETRILAEEHSYHLIGGSSLFQLKVSGTPYIGAASSGSPLSPAPTIVTSTPTSAGASAEFTPTALNIQVRLLDTPWGGYRIEEADQSNFAAHFTLLNNNEPSRFLKAYFSHSVESASRESAFYERYRDRATELFLCPPDALRLNNDDPMEPPWALVFPQLDRLEKYFPPLSQATIAQGAAVGLGMATLFRRLAEDGLINFDIDVSQFCFDPKGRLVIVDFDNVFQMLRDAEKQEQRAPLLNIIRTGQLPAKNQSLPPEARAFTKAAKREEALAKIGPAFSTYMLAIVILQMMANDKSRDDDGYLTLPAGTLLRRAAAEGLKLESVQPFEELLRQMLSASSSDRPQPAEVVTRLQDIIGGLTKENERAKADCLKLLGSLP